MAEVAGPVILIIDDEQAIRRFLGISLAAHGYHVEEASTGETGETRAALLRPDLIILDMGLPDRDGLTVLKSLREWTSTPVIVLSVRNADSDKVNALDAGADDYLTKPFSLEELLARLRVALRHAQGKAESPICTFGRLTIDMGRRVVLRDGQAVKLTPTEYALVRLLVRHAGKVLTHQQLLREVWGPEYIHELHYLRVYFAQLRQKLEDDPAFPRHFVTESGVGYRLIVD